jgi:murein DD-endopeptidase MepM/ murein hydrolase activator NlpD
MTRHKTNPYAALKRKAAKTTSRTRRLIQSHPRSLAATVVSVLMGFGVTAFGLAPMAPDAAKLPQRLVTETIALRGTTQQLEILAGHKLQLFRSDVTRSTDTADILFRRLGINDMLATAFLRHDPVARQLLDGRAGKMIQVRTDAAGNLEELIARYPSDSPDQLSSHFSRLRMSRQDGRFLTKLENVPLEVQVRTGSGVVRTSLFAATDEARIPDSVSAQMADTFSNDIDFHQKLRKGDTFSVLYESLTADGEPANWNQGAGRLLAAEFTNHGRSYSAMWFKESGSKGSYFGFDGKSKNRAFLASPLEFSRVTSGFSMRFHPIHQTWRAHLGVDYAAPTGTPVRSIGEGVVEFAGWQNGYGNVVQIKHSNDRTTLYGHLSRIDVAVGAKLDQGGVLGAVGATGWATGPHLHFEFRVKGQHQDPLMMAKTSESTALSATSLAQFAATSRDWRRQLQAANTVRLSAASYTE